MLRTLAGVSTRVVCTLESVHIARARVFDTRWSVFDTRLRAKMNQLEKVQGILPERQRHNLALTVLYVPCSLGSG